MVRTALQPAPAADHYHDTLGVAEDVQSVGIGCKAVHSTVQTLQPGDQRLIIFNTDEFDSHDFHFTSAAALTGTVAKTSGSPVITGIGTAFTTELSVNQVVSIPGTAAQIFVVKSIESATQFTAWQTAAATATGQTATRKNEYLAIPANLGGLYFVQASGYLETGGSVMTDFGMFVWKNNAEQTGAGGTPNPTGGTTIYINSTWLLRLAPGDFLDNRVFQGAATAKVWGATPSLPGEQAVFALARLGS